MLASYSVFRFTVWSVNVCFKLNCVTVWLFIFHSRRSSHSNCNSKNKTTTKTFKGNGTTEMIYFTWSILQFTPESCRQWQSELSLLWETKDSSFIEQVRDHFLLSYPWMNSQSPFCEFIAWYGTKINDQHIHFLSRSWPFVTNNICISTGTKI